MNVGLRHSEIGWPKPLIGGPKLATDIVWLDWAQRSANHNFIHYSQHNDFTHQALRYEGAISYAQLGGGAYAGHSLVAHLDDVQVQIDKIGRSVEKTYRAGPSDYLISFVFESNSPAWLAYDATENDRRVNLCTPGKQMVRVNAPDRTWAVVKIKRSALARCLQQFPNVSDWFFSLQQGVFQLDSELFVSRMRMDLFQLLEAALLQDNEIMQRAARDLILLSTVQAITWEHVNNREFRPLQLSKNRDRFRSASGLLRDQADDLADGHLAEMLSQFGSLRSVQIAFKESVGLTPLSYLRAIRLNNVRLKLISKDRNTQSIADIATESGFLELGRFAANYREQFGELPSDTRRRTFG